MMKTKRIYVSPEAEIEVVDLPVVLSESIYDKKFEIGEEDEFK